jgi:hypothetical protein
MVDPPIASSNSPQAPRKAPRVKALVVVALVIVLVLVLVWSFWPLIFFDVHDFSENYAQDQLHSYRTDQAIRFLNNKEYADDYRTLVLERGRLSRTFPAFAAAHGPQGTPLNGYRFQELKTLGGKPIDWKQAFALLATPARYGGARRRTFVVLTDGSVYGKDLGKSEFLEDFPADPAAAGWTLAR